MDPKNKWELETILFLEFMLDELRLKWNLQIITELSRQPCSFDELKRTFSRVDTLTIRIDRLQANGLVMLNGQSNYQLTADGQRLNTALEPLRIYVAEWLERPQDQVAALESFDADLLDSRVRSAFGWTRLSFAKDGHREPCLDQ